MLIGCTGDKDTEAESDPGESTDSGSGEEDDSGGQDDVCSDRSYATPSPRAEMNGVWDAAKQRLVVFGGDEGMPVDCRPAPEFLGETWVFHRDCDNFEQLSVEGPSPRSRFAAALDAARNRMIIHGGRYREADSGDYTLYGDTWAFDLDSDTWTQLETTEDPSNRNMHAMVVVGDTLISYGGNNSRSSTSYRPIDTVNVLDLETLEWSVAVTDSDAGGRLFHAVTVSPDGGKLYAYGGGDESAFTGPLFDDLWELDLATWTWTELHDGSGDAPNARIVPNLLHSQSDDKLFLFGGHDDRGLVAPTNVVWVYDISDGAWTELHEGDTPDNTSAGGFCDFPADYAAVDLDAPERRYFNVAAQTNGDDFIIFGGKTDCGQINDVWEYGAASNTWTEHSPATFGEVCLRTFADPEDCSSLCF